MKKILLLSILLFNSFLFAQVNPTLAVGLEKLTMNKGTIDVEVLTEIIMSKQKELKQEALKRFMFKMFPEANFTTKYYVQNCLNVLLNEKNPQVIEKEILELTTNYALSLGVAYVVMRSKTQELIDADCAYENYKFHSPYYQNMIIKENEKTIKNSNKIKSLNSSIKTYDQLVSDNLTTLEKKDIKEDDFDILLCNKKALEKFKRKLAKLNLREDIKNKTINSNNNTLKIPFGIVLDVVSLSLSDLPELQKKGFFKNKIDYTSSDFYLNLELNEEGKKLKSNLDILKLHCCKKMRPYIQNYDIINEFLKKNKGKTVLDIKKNLQDESINFLIQMINKKTWFSNDSTIKSTLDEIANLENSISIINYNTISTVPKKIDAVSVDCDICNKVNAYKESIVYQSSLETFNKNIVNQDSNIRDLTKELIKLSPLKSFDFPVKTMSKLIVLENTNPEPIVTDINNSINKLNYKIDNLVNFSKNNRNKLIIEILSDAIKLKNYIIYQYPYDKLNALNTIKINNLIEGNYLNVNILEFNENVDKIKISKNNLFEIIDKKNKEKESIKDEITIKIKCKYAIITQSDNFYNEYLTDMLDQGMFNNFNTTDVDSITISEASVILSNMHTKIKSLINNNDIQMSDIVYLDDYINEKMIALKIRDKNNDSIYNQILNHNKTIIPLLKIRALQKIDEIIDYDEELMNLFEFIANLNNLDKAETYQSIVNMLRDGSKKIEDNLSAGEFKDSYVLFINAMKKYTLINPSEEYVEIDVVSFLNELQQYYDRNNKSRFSLYLSLGLNQNFFFEDFKFSEEDKINNISFASEKIGVKYRIKNFNRLEGYENVVKDDIYLNKKAPFVNQCYVIIYGAGLLYTLANTTTNQNFDFPHVGVGFGMRFYNALDLNLILGFPFVKDSNFGDNAFWGIGLDIPLGEYLEKLGSK